MRWFAVRALGLWLALIMITSAVVLVVRADPESPTLKAVGLSLCDGAPCFRGLKVGSSLMEVQNRFPDSSTQENHLSLPLNVGGIKKALVILADDGKTVKNIGLSTYCDGTLCPQTPITAGEIVARYGAPCLLMIWERPDGPSRVILIYPKFQVFVNVVVDYASPLEYQLQLTSPVSLLWMPYGAVALTCDSPLDKVTGRWQGFISADLYLARFRTNLVK